MLLIDTEQLLQKCFTRACMYLTKGYIDKTEKDNFSVMEWEDFIMKEVANDCERVSATSKEDR